MSRQSGNISTDNDEWRKKSKKKPRGEYTLEYRCNPDSLIVKKFPEWGQWKTYHKRYRSERERDMALKALERKDGRFYEFRLPKEKEADKT